MVDDHPVGPHPRVGGGGGPRGASTKRRVPPKPGAPPTLRQIYAIAAALCDRNGESFPETRAVASELIERLRVENGHPAPRLEDTALYDPPVWLRYARGSRRSRSR